MTLRNKRTQRGGFTIIELLIVVIVIGVLAAAGIGKYQGFAENARTKTCTLNIQTVENGIAMWCTQNSSLGEAVEGLEAINKDGYTWGWSGTQAPFRNTWAIADTIRDTKAFRCPKVLAEVGGQQESYPGGWTGAWSGPGGAAQPCGDNIYGFYYGGVGFQSWNNNTNFWNDPAGANTGHQIAWCRAYGGFRCEAVRPNMRKYVHSNRWGL